MKIWKVGETTPPVEKKITQEFIDRYAEVAVDFNPLHVDPEYARNTPFGNTIAHGQLILSFISQSIAKAFGERWSSGSFLKAIFLAPVHPGDTVTAQGKVQEIVGEGDETYALVDLWCENQKGEKVVAAEGRVRVEP